MKSQQYSLKDRRRDGLAAKMQRRFTTWIFSHFHLRRQSDAGTRRTLLLLLNMLFSLSLIPKTGWGSSGTEGASFLNIPVGGRPAALGAGYTAMAADVYAPTYNAAGLGFVEDNQLAGQHLAYLESIHYEYFSFVHPLGNNRGIGTSMQYLGSGDIAGTDINGNSTGNFSSHYAAYSMAYGQTVGERLSIGVTGKWINAKIDDVSANAFAADLGSFYKLTHRLSLASTLTNIGSSLKFINQGDSLPLAWHVGAVFFAHPQVTLNGEVEYRKTGLASAHMGAEWSPIGPVSIRVGYKTDTTKQLSPVAGFTTGIGLKVHGAEFDYAWLPYGELGNTQYFSAVLRFGGVPEPKRNLIHFRPAKIEEHAAVEDNSEYQELGKMLTEGTPEAVASREPVEPKHATVAEKQPKDADDALLQDLLDSAPKRPLAQHPNKPEKDSAVD